VGDGTSDQGVEGAVLRIAITGNMGSGKSSLANLLRARGAQVVDADAMARQLLASDEPVRRALANTFGADLLDSNGLLRRDLLAERAFVNDAARQQLDELIREPLEELLFRSLEKAAETNRVVILDAPLLFEWRIEARFDVVIVVTSSTKNALQRLQRRGVCAEQARRRRSTQWPNKQQVELADIVINNDQDLTHLAAQADQAWALIQDRIQGRDVGSE
jgi:dephospho-CoA kinase